MYSCSFPVPRSIFRYPFVGESCRQYVPSEGPRMPSKQALALNILKLEDSMFVVGLLSVHVGVLQLSSVLQFSPVLHPQLLHLFVKAPLSQYFGFVVEHCPYCVPSEQVCGWQFGVYHSISCRTGDLHPVRYL